MGLSLNKAMIIGNLGADPEVFQGRKEGSLVVKFPVATSYRKGGRGGEEITTWHRVVCFGQPAEIAEKWLYKGAKVYVEGYTESWKTEEGKSGMDLIARELILLSPMTDDQRAGERQSAPEPPQQYRRGKQQSSGYERRGAPGNQRGGRTTSAPGAAQRGGRGGRTVGRPNPEYAEDYDDRPPRDSDRPVRKEFPDED